LAEDVSWLERAGNCLMFGPSGVGKTHLAAGLTRKMVELGQWDSIFVDSMMTVATVDRLVHHGTIFEIKTDSYRRQAATARLNQSAAV
jgi:DNA replication protein DnaC